MRSMFIAVNKNTALPKFSWERFSDPEKKTGGIRLTTETYPKNIYAWVMDSRSNFRRDFRIAGVVDNEKGAYWKPEYPDYPPGYPDKAPEGGKKGPKRVKDEGNFKVINTEFEFCQELEFNPDEWCRFMLERNMTKELDEFLLVHKQFNPSYKPPRLDVDLQVQLNLSRKIMATQVGPKEYIIELDEATDAFRAFFFHIEFQGPDELRQFEFTSEAQIIPERPPFEECFDKDCQGALI